MTVRVRLSDGEVVDLEPEAHKEVYDRLWSQARRGSIIAALKIEDARRGQSEAQVVELTEQESTAFREAWQKCSAADAWDSRSTKRLESHDG